MFLDPGATGNLKVGRTTDLHSVVLHLAPVTFPHHFPTECTEEELLAVRAASGVRMFLPVVYARNRNK